MEKEELYAPEFEEMNEVGQVAKRRHGARRKHGLHFGILSVDEDEAHLRQSSEELREEDKRRPTSWTLPRQQKRRRAGK